MVGVGVDVREDRSKFSVPSVFVPHSPSHSLTSDPSLVLSSSVPGSMREVDVIDVSRQDDIRMKMREWTEYYENQRPRKKILNVISLEFSNTG